MDNNSVKTSFSRRETEIVERLSRGYTEKEIAEELFISPATVNNHLSNIRNRYGLHKNTEIILMYISNKNNKKFDIKKIREYGISIILVVINICSMNKIFS